MKGKPIPAKSKKRECDCELRVADLVKAEEVIRFNIKLVKCPLCAAAPELLETARQLLITLDMLTPHEFMRGGLRSDVEQLKTVIRKAEARS